MGKPICIMAAGEIARLRAENKRLKKRGICERDCPACEIKAKLKELEGDHD